MAESEERELKKVETEYEHEADELEQRSDQLGEDIDDVRQEWKRKRGDSQVPGALPEDDDAEGAVDHD
jgi:uncharacterized protein YukE